MTTIASKRWISGCEGDLQITYEVLDSGTVRMRRLDSAEWKVLTRQQVCDLSRRSTMSECLWWQSLPSDIRQGVLASHGLVSVQMYPCAGHRDGCSNRVTLLGGFCPSCQHDN